MTDIISESIEMQGNGETPSQEVDRMVDELLKLSNEEGLSEANKRLLRILAKLKANTETSCDLRPLCNFEYFVLYRVGHGLALSFNIPGATRNTEIEIRDYIYGTVFTKMSANEKEANSLRGDFAAGRLILRNISKDEYDKIGRGSNKT